MFQQKDGNTALHHAAAGGQVKMCRFLLLRGADVHAKNQVNGNVTYVGVPRDFPHANKELLKCELSLPQQAISPSGIYSYRETSYYIRTKTARTNNHENINSQCVNVVPMHVAKHICNRFAGRDFVLQLCVCPCVIVSYFIKYQPINF